MAVKYEHKEVTEYQTNIEEFMGKEFYVTRDTDGSVSFAPTFKADVLNIMYKTEEGRKKKKKWIHKVKNLGKPWSKEEVAENLKACDYPYVVNFYGGGGIHKGERRFCNTLEEAMEYMNISTIKSSPFGNK